MFTLKYGPNSWRRIIADDAGLTAGQKILANVVLDELCGMLHQRDYFTMMRDILSGRESVLSVIAACRALITLLEAALKAGDEMRGGNSSCLN
jgi:hypothetical protein